MTFDELCVALIDEAEGVQNGVADYSTLEVWPRAQSWVKRAYERIQHEQKWWGFLFHSKALFTTTSGHETYSVCGVRETDPEAFRITVNGIDNRLTWIDYPEWRNLFLVSRPSAGIPAWITRLPSGEFRVTPTPNASFVVKADWFATASSLVDGSDEPIWEEEFHELILWKALVAWAEEYDVPALAARVAQNLPRLERSFRNRYLPATR